MTSIVVAGGIIWQDDHLLAALRPQGKPMAGYWEFPGGKLEPGETAEQALCRELREELGISVRACRLWQIVEHDYAVAAGEWPRERLVGREIAGKTLGLVGFGGIARKVAARARACGTRVIAHDPFLPADADLVASLPACAPR